MSHDHGLMHAEPTDSEHYGATRVGPWLESRRGLVASAFYLLAKDRADAGRSPWVTCNQVATYLQNNDSTFRRWTPDDVRPRKTDLVDAGYLRDTGHHRTASDADGGGTYWTPVRLVPPGHIPNVVAYTRKAKTKPWADRLAALLCNPGEHVWKDPESLWPEESGCVKCRVRLNRCPAPKVGYVVDVPATAMFDELASTKPKEEDTMPDAVQRHPSLRVGHDRVDLVDVKSLDVKSLDSWVQIVRVVKSLDSWVQIVRVWLCPPPPDGVGVSIVDDWDMCRDQSTPIQKILEWSRK